MANKTKKDKLNPIYENLTDWKAEYNELREKHQKLIGQHMEAVSLLVLKDKEIDSLKESIATLETDMAMQNRWRNCEVPNEDGLYDLPVENKEYLVEFVSDTGEPDPFVTSCDWDCDGPGWDNAPYDCHARRWREIPEPPEYKDPR